MAISKLLFLVFYFLVQHVLTANGIGKHRLLPAVYVFGSSAVDAGNNNHLNTLAKANVWPYGIDFNNVTGRYSNGKIGPTLLGECLTLVQQVEYFTLTVMKDLLKALKNQKKLHQHLAKSIYILFLGINDYNKLVYGNIMDKFSRQGFADYLLDEITGHFKTLYDLGARKFVVYGILKCEPYQYTQGCESRYYRDKLPQRLLKLQAELPCSLFTIYDVYNAYKQILENHEKYGITNIKEPCYVEGKPICPDRSKYHLFDKWGHQTEVSCEITSKDCFNGTSCSPYTLFELAKAPIHCPRG